jgi:hypothetical protein
MPALGGLSAQDIVSIAAAGVMGLSALFIVITLLRPNPPAPGPLWAAVAVIGIATVVQLGTKYMELVVTAHDRVSVTLAPNPKSFAEYLPNDSGAPITARPKIWLARGDVRCNPNSSAYDGTAPCLYFDKEFPLDDRQETIYVSVEDAMAELRDRVLRLTAVTRAAAATQIATSGPGASRPSPIGDNTSPQ